MRLPFGRTKGYHVLNPHLMLICSYNPIQARREWPDMANVQIMVRQAIHNFIAVCQDVDYLANKSDISGAGMYHAVLPGRLGMMMGGLSSKAPSLYASCFPVILRKIPQHHKGYLCRLCLLTSQKIGNQGKKCSTFGVSISCMTKTSPSRWT